MKRIFINLSAFVLFAGTVLVSCSDDDNDNNNNNQPQQTIAQIASGNPNFSILVAALNRTGLTSTLNGSGQFTVFAPTDEAFETFFDLLPGNQDVNTVNIDVLRNTLLNHVIATEIPSSAIPASTYVNTLSPFSSAAGAPTISMFVQKSGNTVTINGGPETQQDPTRKGATVSQADLDASNGVIHVVNRVIQIPNIVDHAKANPNFTTLTGLLADRGLVPVLQQSTTDTGTLAPFTVFAPVNSAFTQAVLDVYTGLANDDLRAQVLKYHVVGGVNVRSNAIPSGNINTLQGEGFTITGTAINDAGSTVDKNIILTDVQASNGIIHAIDGVLLPAFN